jgi:translation initiation factor IF-3
VNEQIRAREVRLVGPEGEQVGIVPLERALQLAADVDLDLVEVAPMARPPVCKLMDFGKFKYESALKAREARRNQQQTVIKEMKLRPKIDSHDYETKKGHVVRFLKAGDKVKVTIMFRGREQSRPELGFRLLRRLSEEISELGFVEAAPKQDGRNMIMVLAPHRATKAAAVKTVMSRGRDGEVTPTSVAEVNGTEVHGTEVHNTEVHNTEVSGTEVHGNEVNGAGVLGVEANGAGGGVAGEHSANDAA